MTKIVLTGGLLFFFFLTSGCRAEISIRSYPNPVPNTKYFLIDTYETKVLKGPANPKSELVEAVNIDWEYVVKGKSQYIPANTTVLKDLVTEIQHDEKGKRDFIEWMAEVKYNRPDGVVDQTQIVIHRYKKTTN